MNRVDKKVALVTGGANGLGKAIARRLVEEGAKVIISDLQQEQGESAAQQLQCEFYLHNVANEMDWQDLMQYIERRYDGLHILVNNAGIEGPVTSSPADISLDDWRRVQQVNVEGTFLGCRSAMDLIQQSGGGAITNISSIAAFNATPDITAYGASKAAVRHLTKSIAMHCAQTGTRIRCNSVHPGLVRTQMLNRIFGDEDLTAAPPPAEDGAASQSILLPQGEYQTPEDIANAVLFLSSDEAKHITGAQLTVDGGLTMHG